MFLGSLALAIVIMGALLFTFTWIAGKLGWIPSMCGDDDDDDDNE